MNMIFNMDNFVYALLTANNLKNKQKKSAAETIYFLGRSIKHGTGNLGQPFTTHVIGSK